MATHRSEMQAGAMTSARAGLREHHTESETKLGFKTTEFMLTVIGIAALIVATYVTDLNLSTANGWKYASWVAVAYIISRGLAKLGTGEMREETYDRGA